MTNHTSTMRRLLHTTLRTTLFAALVAGAGCGSDTTATTAPPDLSQIYWKLRLNHHAVTLNVGTAPYDTVQLSATPLTPAGTPLDTEPTVTYSVLSSDTSVQVSSTGLVRAHSVKPNVLVVAAATVHGLTLKDTVAFNVTNLAGPIPRLKVFSIHPVAPDSAKVDLSGLTPKTLTTTMQDSTNATIPASSVLISYTSANSAIATISPTGVVTANGQGQVMLYAETDLYGVTKRDSLLFTIGMPLFQQVVIVAETPLGSQSPISVFGVPVTIGVNGKVAWVNRSGQPVDIVFDDPTNVKAVPAVFRFIGFLFTVTPDGGGDIPAFPSVPAGAVLLGLPYIHGRFFPVAGTYTYHSTLYGTTGSVIVK